MGIDNIINLTKGQVINLSKMPSIDLSKGGTGLHNVMVGLGWDSVRNMPFKKEKKGFLQSLLSSFSSEEVEDMPDIDCDAFAVVLKNGVFSHKDSKQSLIYYGNLCNSNDAVYHTGDNLTGDGEGDDEQIIINLDKLDGNIVKLGVTIYEAISRRQHFGLLQNAFIRLVDMQTDKELCRYTLDSKYNNEVSLWFGELVKLNNEWSFTALGTVAKGRDIGDAVKEFSV